MTFVQLFPRPGPDDPYYGPAIVNHYHVILDAFHSCLLSEEHTLQIPAELKYKDDIFLHYITY